MDSRPDQFSLRQVLISMALLAGACGMASLAVRSFWKFENWGVWIGVAAGSTFLVGGAGMFTRQPAKWFLYGSVAGLLFAFMIVRADAWLAIIPILILIFTTRKYQKREVSTFEESIKRRQKSIYRVSAVCSIVLLVVWLSILALIPPGGACRPMGAALITIAFILPTTLFNAARAIRQLVETWPEKRWGLLALFVALSPIAIYAFTQWMILSVFSIIYED